MNVKKYKIQGTGGGLLMHSDAALNPRHPVLAKINAITSKGSKNRTEADVLELQRLEFVIGMYWDEEIGPYLPAHVIEACLRDAAKQRKLGKELTRSIMLLEDKVRLEYRGPRDQKGLWEKGFYDARSVKIGRNRVMRTRPHFADWWCEFSVSFDPEFIDEKTLDWAVEVAGQRVGIGDFRPRFGRFEVAA